MKVDLNLIWNEIDKDKSNFSVTRKYNLKTEVTN